jgi:hypothetical protein
MQHAVECQIVDELRLAAQMALVFDALNGRADE